MTMWWNAGTSIGCFKNTQWNLVALLWMQDSILVSGPMVNFGMIASMTKLSMSHLAWCGFANFPRICKQNSMTSKLADCTCERAPSLHATISSSPPMSEWCTVDPYPAISLHNTPVEQSNADTICFANVCPIFLNTEPEMMCIRRLRCILDESLGSHDLKIECASPDLYYWGVTLCRRFDGSMNSCMKVWETLTGPCPLL